MDSLLLKLEAHQQQASYAFLRAYVPDNVAVEQGGLDLLSKVDESL
jgi:hypothetical protein